MTKKERETAARKRNRRRTRAPGCSGGIVGAAAEQSPVLRKEAVAGGNGLRW
jgi:hypothetical protein